MNPRTPGVETILAEAVEIASATDRQDFVERSCAGDPALRKRVERLIADHFRAGSFLERPAAVLDEDATGGYESPPAAERPGAMIGPYKLLEQIGEGGMGLVYVAEQQRPVRRTVALKLIKPGMDSKEVIARFEAERQALALMDHPNIAKVLDAGTNDAGRPYFVMELVRGVPITEYCDQARLTVRQRLEAFVQVCRAVQHAHTKGVIHRDLKPTNVLTTSLDGVPTPIVIDFGVAKALGSRLTERTLHTGFAQTVGTPMYMSPEQCEFNQLGVDTRSDVYSLGVLLYELLTGAPPFDQERLRAVGHDEFRRILREEEPPRPSARRSTLGLAHSTASERRGVDARKLTQTLRGELDWIVMRALEKDRNRRYESAGDLAADVQRYLNDEPVAACPPSAGYRLRKFARRNRRALATAGVVAVALVAATAVSTWQAVRASDAQRQAEADRDRARAAELQAKGNEDRALAAERRAATEAAVAKAVNDFVVGDLFLQINPELQVKAGFTGEPNLTVKEALRRAESRIGQRFADRPLVEAPIRRAMGRAFMVMGEPQLALACLERAYTLCQANLGSDDPQTLDALDNVAQAYSETGQWDKAVALMEQQYEKRKATNGPKK